MALVECRECRKQISTEAETCPHCGTPEPSGLNLKRGRCFGCGRQIAVPPVGTCPHCGIEKPLDRLIKKKDKESLRQGCGIGCLALVCLLVFVGLISLVESSRPSTPSTSSARPSQPRNQPFHAREAVNIRSGPGTSHAIARTLEPGDKTYPASTNSEGWAPVRSGPTSRDTIGWVMRELLISGNPPDLLLISWDWETGGRYGAPSIAGEVKNLTDRTYSYVQITCTLFDAQRRQVGQAWTNTTDLAAGRTWRFSAIVTVDHATRYRCLDPEGW